MMKKMLLFSMVVGAVQTQAVTDGTYGKKVSGKPVGSLDSKAVSSGSDSAQDIAKGIDIIGSYVSDKLAGYSATEAKMNKNNSDLQKALKGYEKALLAAQAQVNSEISTAAASDHEIDSLNIVMGMFQNVQSILSSIQAVMHNNQQTFLQLSPTYQSAMKKLMIISMDRQKSAIAGLMQTLKAEQMTFDTLFLDPKNLATYLGKNYVNDIFEFRKVLNSTALAQQFGIKFIDNAS